MVRISRVLIAVAAAGLLVSACTVKKTERPPLAGPSELALSLSLSANPDTLTADGSSQSRVVILARDQNGLAIKGLPLHVELIDPTITATGQLSSDNVTTGTDGRATVNYTAPFLGLESGGKTVTISVTPTGTDYANTIPRSVSIRLVPAGYGPTANFTWSPAMPVPNSAVTFDGSGSTSDSGTIASYSWDFGDGSTGTGVRPQHTYRAVGDYQVTLIVVDDKGRMSTPCTQTVTVAEGESPTAAFVFSPSAPIPLQTIFFNASTSTPGAGRTIVAYAWNFGNGTTAQGVTTSTSYNAIGTYNVTLVITDDIGQTASKSQAVIVALGTATADFAITVTGNDVPNNTVNVFVDASASKPSSGQAIASYEWIFGDGTPMSTTSVRTNTHAYPNPGTTGTPPVGRTITYTITLTVVDTGGARAATTKTVTITGF